MKQPNELVIKLANSISLTEDEGREVSMLISGSTDVVGQQTVLKHTSALFNQQDLAHLVWVAIKDGKAVGWASAGIHIDEYNDCACVMLDLFTIYVLPEFRHLEIGESIIETVANDTARLAAKELKHQSIDAFFESFGDEEEMITIEIEVSATCVSSGGHILTGELSYRFEKMLEKHTDNQPYVTGNSVSLVDEAY